MARVYGEFYHAGGVAKELRNIMLGSRTPDDAMAGMEWLYGEQQELTRGLQGHSESSEVTRCSLVSGSQ